MCDFRYLGFKDYEYVVSRSISNLTVSLTADSEELDEIVVTGISEEKKSKLRFCCLYSRCY